MITGGSVVNTTMEVQGVQFNLSHTLKNSTNKKSINDFQHSINFSFKGRFLFKRDTSKDMYLHVLVCKGGCTNSVGMFI